MVYNPVELSRVAYVDPVVGHNASAAIGSTIHKFKTIAAALAAVPDGGAVVVAPGVYTENLTVPPAIAAVALRGVSAGAVTLVGNITWSPVGATVVQFCAFTDLTVTGNITVNTTGKVNVAGVTFRGFNLRHAGNVTVTGRGTGVDLVHLAGAYAVGTCTLLDVAAQLLAITPGSFTVTTLTLSDAAATDLKAEGVTATTTYIGTGCTVTTTGGTIGTADVFGSYVGHGTNAAAVTIESGATFDAFGPRLTTVTVAAGGACRLYNPIISGDVNTSGAYRQYGGEFDTINVLADAAVIMNVHVRGYVQVTSVIACYACVIDNDVYNGGFGGQTSLYGCSVAGITNDDPGSSMGIYGCNLNLLDADGMIQCFYCTMNTAVLNDNAGTLRVYGGVVVTVENNTTSGGGTLELLGGVQVLGTLTAAAGTTIDAIEADTRLATISGDVRVTGRNGTFKTITSSEVAGNEEKCVIDASGGDVDYTLPPIENCVGRTYHVIRKDSSGNLVHVVADGSETIIGAGFYAINPYGSFKFWNDGIEWFID